MSHRCFVLVLSCALAACSEGAAPEAAPTGFAAPARPSAGVPVAPGDLGEALASAEDGDVLLLQPGTHEGQFRIERAVTLWGSSEAIVRSTGKGTTLEIVGDGARLLGFTVDGSGGRFDLLDAAVHVQAKDVTVEGLRIVNALFGILVEKSERVTVRGNRVVGTGHKALGLRGDGIRLWETRDSVIASNHVTDSRDVVVWYSSGNRIEDNVVTGSRYGTHFMYSHENVVTGNRYEGDVVGVFVMYSRDVELRHNVMARASGAAGVGLGIKESGNLTVVENAFLRDTTGIYLDTSPLDVDHHNVFERNIVRMSDTGIAFHASPHRNVFRGNSIRDNVRQVAVGGAGDALDITWDGNDFDDYAGYDLDGDGYGDVPYELRTLAGDLTSKRPNVAFLRGTPTLAVVDVVGRVLPLFAPRKLLVDERPRMAPLSLEVVHAR